MEMRQKEAVENMTREEAKTILKNAAWLGTHEDRDKVEQAVDMAIQALENHDTFMKYAYSQGKHDALSQEPTITTNNNEPITIIYPTIVCDDAISREAVIQLFNGNIGSEAALILHKVKQLPPVTQKSGKWEFHCQHWSKCSICGYADKFAEKWNYCPNCGAKMENVEKSLIDIKAESEDKE